tara:strand:- start:12247 stop:12600 length:354 start_codon:yes stop_codon:yes gene_type:complete
MTTNANQKLFSLTQLVAKMKAVDPQQARFRNDRIIENLKKRKRTAMKIASSIHGSYNAHFLLEEGKDDPELVELYAVQEGINRAESLYRTFESVWTNYCARYWTEQLYPEDYLDDYS